MEMNFRFLSSVEIAAGEDVLDLHNDFDAVKIEHDIAASRISSYWKRVAEQGHPKLLIITFINVHSMEVKGLDPDMPRKEDRRLSFMGYARPDNHTLSGFLPEEAHEDDHSIIFAFEGGFAIKARSESVLLTVAESHEP